MGGRRAPARVLHARAAIAASGATTWRRSWPGPRIDATRRVAPPPPSVLVVDDDAGLREFIRANLEAEGFSVREAGSATEGLAALDEEPPDLILLDVMMPQMDGWEMLRRVQERHGVDAIQVIMYSGKLEEAGKAEERGAQAFIGKPFDPGKLLAATKQLLGS